MVKQNDKRAINTSKAHTVTTLFSSYMLIQWLLLLTIQSCANGLTCWTCHNARSNENCLNQGRLRRCSAHKASCQNELRRDDKGILITKTCKQTKACRNKFNYGDLVELTPISCTVHRRRGTVCRCCCSESLCNQNALYCKNTKPRAEDQHLLSREASKPVFLQNMCYKQTSPQNGWVKCSNQNKIRSVCKFGCDEGYRLEGESRSTICSYRGSWTKPAPSCRQSGCGPDPAAPENGGILCDRDQQNLRICRFSCQQGYKVIGTSITICQRRGNNFKWQHPVPKCQELDECAKEERCFNGGTCLIKNRSYKCQCLDGFSGLNCERVIPACRGTPNAPENGKMTCTNRAYLGSRCIFVCDRGYRQSGKRVSTCQYYGMDGPYWSNLSPTVCRVPREPCSAPVPAPTNGLIACSNDNNAGSVCEYICFDSYQLIGQTKSQCLSVNGISEWTNNEPRHCEKAPPAACVEQPNTPKNGYRECTGDSVGSICNFFCNDGYRLQGPSFVTCVYNRQGALYWESIIPQLAVCLEINPDCSQDLLPPENGKITCTDGRNAGSVCQYSCLDGFNLLGASVVTCKRSGFQIKWDYSEPIICEEMMPSALCTTSPAIPANGNMLCSDESFIGSTCVFFCDDGYILVGAEEITCRNSQVVPADWSSPSPTCSEIIPDADVCPDVDEVGVVPPRASALCSDGNKVGSFCQIVCEDGYEISGFSGIICEANRVWSTGLPKPACIELQPKPLLECVDIYATSLVPLYSYAICSEDSKIGSLCEVACEEGFQLFGSNVFVCEQKKDGTPDWIGDIPPLCEVDLPPPI